MGGLGSFLLYQLVIPQSYFVAIIGGTACSGTAFVEYIPSAGSRIAFASNFQVTEVYAAASNSMGFHSHFCIDTDAIADPGLRYRR